MADLKDQGREGRSAIDNAADRSRNVTPNTPGASTGQQNKGMGGTNTGNTSNNSGNTAGNTGTTGSATGVTDQVRQGAEQAFNAASEFVSDAKNKIGDWTSNAGNVAGQVGDTVQQYAHDAYECTTETMMNFGTEVTNVVKRYPIQSVLVGFGIGLLIGRTVRST